MATASGYILILNNKRLRILENQLFFGEYFAEPVPEFSHSRNLPLVCFVNNIDGQTKYLALAKRGQKAGTDLRRLNLFEIRELSQNVNLGSYADGISKLFRAKILATISNGGPFTPKQFRALVDAIVASDTELGNLLRRYSTVRAERISALSSEVKRELAYQKEAVTAALTIAGYDRTPLQSWDPPLQGTPSSFLDGIEQARLREDPMVVQDFTNVPGYSLIRTLTYGAAIFEGKDRSRLTVILANRQPLEQLTGADLIYYNERYKSFVMVQYKAMESAGSTEPIFRIPNAQLDEELRRMDEILASLSGAESAEGYLGFRFSSNPFFFKFCPRIVFNPDDVSLIPGMYIPIEYWKLLAASESISGARGGQGLTYKNVARYLDNTSFMTIVSQAWVGTTPSQSILLEAAIRNTIELGRAAVIAVHTPAADQPEVDAPVDKEGFF